MSTARKTLKDLLAEMRAIQDEFKGKAMPEDRAAAFETLATEAKAWQDEADRAARILAAEEAERKGLTVADGALPQDGQPSPKPDTKAVAGYMELGAYVLAQKDITGILARAKTPGSSIPLMALKGRNLLDRFVPLTREQVAEIKAVPTLGADVIEPTRLPELVRATEQDTLRIRDLINTTPTTSDAVMYNRLVSYTRAAAATAAGSQKPEAAMAMDTVTEAVRTIPVWIPVNNQQLADLPVLQNLIQGELLYDVNKHLEELMVYGDGTGENFLGLAKDPDVLACRTVSGDTLIDIVRRGITDVRVSGYEPNVVMVHPLDWETIVLEKGSDNRYVWVVVTEGGVSRLWGSTVVETVGVEDFAGNATEERCILVGDGRRGATLYDRQEATVSVGWINDQFIRNQRTLLAEGRWAFGVPRPRAFRKHVAQAAVAS